RAATVAAASPANRRHLQALPDRPLEYRRADGSGMREIPHESDADNWVPPPPAYGEHLEDQLASPGSGAARPALHSQLNTPSAPARPNIAIGPTLVSALHPPPGSAIAPHDQPNAGPIPSHLDTVTAPRPNLPQSYETRFHQSSPRIVPPQQQATLTAHPNSSSPALIPPFASPRATGTWPRAISSRGPVPQITAHSAHPLGMSQPQNVVASTPSLQAPQAHYGHRHFHGRHVSQGTSHGASGSDNARPMSRAESRMDRRMDASGEGGGRRLRRDKEKVKETEGEKSGFKGLKCVVM
ncbi:hypothetical protein LTS18_013010, partial [Coniosporium uncinatum]